MSASLARAETQAAGSRSVTRPRCHRQAVWTASLPRHLGWSRCHRQPPSPLCHGRCALQALYGWTRFTNAGGASIRPVQSPNDRHGRSGKRRAHCAIPRAYRAGHPCTRCPGTARLGCVDTPPVLPHLAPAASAGTPCLRRNARPQASPMTRAEAVWTTHQGQQPGLGPVENPYPYPSESKGNLICI